MTDLEMRNAEKLDELRVQLKQFRDRASQQNAENEAEIAKLRQEIQVRKARTKKCTRRIDWEWKGKRKGGREEYIAKDQKRREKEKSRRRRVEMSREERRIR